MKIFKDRFLSTPYRESGATIIEYVLIVGMLASILAASTIVLQVSLVRRVTASAEMSNHVVPCGGEGSRLSGQECL